MTPASTGKSTTARVAVVLFSASLMGGFVWYSHIKAQPAGEVTATGDASTRQMILPGSKRSNAAIVPDDVKELENGVIELDLKPTAEQSSEAPNSKEGTILPSSKLGIFRDMVSSPGSAPAIGKGATAPTPPSPVMLSGSKSFAGPVVSAGHLGSIVLGNGSKEASQLTIQSEIPQQQPLPPPSRVMMLGSKSMPAPPVNPEVLKKLIEKSQMLPAQTPPAAEPASKTQAPAPAKKPEAASKPQADTPAPASP